MAGRGRRVAKPVREYPGHVRSAQADAGRRVSPRGEGDLGAQYELAQPVDEIRDDAGGRFGEETIARANEAQGTEQSSLGIAVTAPLPCAGLECRHVVRQLALQEARGIEPFARRSGPCGRGRRGGRSSRLVVRGKTASACSSNRAPRVARNRCQRSFIVCADGRWARCPAGGKVRNYNRHLSRALPQRCSPPNA